MNFDWMETSPHWERCRNSDGVPTGSERLLLRVETFCELSAIPCVPRDPVDWHRPWQEWAAAHEDRGYQWHPSPDLLLLEFLRRARTG